MFAYFDIETDGLDAHTCAFKCGVVHIDETYHQFVDAIKMVVFLKEISHRATIVSFNGVSFDFQVLAHKAPPPLRQAMAEIANSSAHIDIMFAFAAAHGYYASMQSFAESLDLSKTWDGKSAAESTDIAAVIEYCKQDVTVLQKVHAASMQSGKLCRNSAAGRKMTWVLPAGKGPRSVSLVIADLAIIQPNQTWMSKPPKLPQALNGWTVPLLVSSSPQ
tara:strand:- start:194 stop:850 length:657 start_codon:yes stop_codon:yes gene_type:complete